MKRYIKWIIAVIVVATAVFFIKLPSVVKRVSLKRLEEITGRRIEAEKFRYNYIRNILYIDDFKIYEEDGERVFVSFASFNINIDIIYLVRREFLIRELTLVEPNVRVEYTEDRANYTSIFERMEEQKKKESIEGEEVIEGEGFIKKVDLKNLTVESFTLHYEDMVITAENNFTFRSPNLTYENKIFNLSSKLDFLGKGEVEFDIKYSESGEIEGQLLAKDLLLDDKLYIAKSLYGIESVEGVVDTQLEFSGDEDGNYNLKGIIAGKNLRMESEKNGELFTLKRLEGSLDEISTGENRYVFSNVILESGRVDTIKITDYIDGLSQDDDDPAEDSKESEFVVESLEGKDLDIISELGNITRGGVELKNFATTGKKEFTFNTSFIYEDVTQIDLKSVNTFNEGAGITKETVVSSGSLKIEGKNEEFVKRFLSQEREYDFLWKDFTYTTDYSYSYPRVDLKNQLSMEGLTLLDITEGYKEIKSEKIATDNEIIYNLEDETYSLRGGVEGETISIVDKEGIAVIEADLFKGDNFLYSQESEELAVGGDLQADNFNFIEEGSRMTLKGEMVSADKFLYTSSGDIYEIKGNIDLKNFNVLNDNGEASLEGAGVRAQINSLGSSGYDLISLDLERVRIYLEKMKSEESGEKVTDSDPSTYPVINIGKLTINQGYISEERFTMGINFTGEDIGTLKGSSELDFSGDFNSGSAIALKGRMTKPRDIKTDKDLKLIGFKGSGDIRSLDLKGINKFLEDENYDLMGSLTVNSKIDYKNSSLNSENFVYLESGNIAIEDTEITIGSLTSKNNFTFKGDDYTFKGETSVNKLYTVTEGMKFSAEEIKSDINKVTPAEVRVERILIKKPLIKLSVAKESAAAKSKVGEDVKVEDVVEKKEGEKKPEVVVGKIYVEGGRVEYRAPDLRYNIRDIKVVVADFTTEAGRDFKSDFSADLTGTGTLKGKFVSSLERRWDFNPTSLNIKGDFHIANLDLLDFKEYLSTKLPNEIDSGKLNYEGAIDLHKGRFKGENVITVKTIYIGEETEVSSIVPLKIAVGILKDRKGNLLLDVPISGDFNDPKFRVYRVVLQAIKNILIKAATSPVNILSRAFNLGSKEIILLKYDYISETPTAEGMSKLKKIAKMMKAKEGLNIVFTLFTNREAEKIRLNEELKKAKFFKRETKDEELEVKIDELIDNRKKYLEEYFRKKLLEKRVTVEVSDIPREAPVSGVDFIFK